MTIQFRAVDIVRGALPHVELAVTTESRAFRRYSLQCAIDRMRRALAILNREGDHRNKARVMRMLNWLRAEASRA